jgi:ribosome-associated toxin RatA of RatAB toxin-antitoxin module
MFDLVNDIESYPNSCRGRPRIDLAQANTVEATLDIVLDPSELQKRAITLKRPSVRHRIS